MTSPRFNSTRALAAEELRIFNMLPRQLRDAMNNAETQPPRPSIVRDTLLRGVSAEKIIETINKARSPKP